eukprot:TRINITY_DN20911_c0_g2_i2.p1 TRINITY_DN20911_c0_g2~~TRINITY_DN20911_c0_g2_i2.p1  ORF type:complete len:279 (-),score=25.42 TRINITY_DN20911_c0_g2_i2:115-951(-)
MLHVLRMQVVYSTSCGMPSIFNDNPGITSMKCKQAFRARTYSLFFLDFLCLLFRLVHFRVLPVFICCVNPMVGVAEGELDDAGRSSSRLAGDALAAASASLRSCCICLTAELPAEDGVTCEAAAGDAEHFVCTPCFRRHVDMSIQVDVYLRRAANGRIGCPGRPCKAPPYGHSIIKAAVPADLYSRYLSSMSELSEVVLTGGGQEAKGASGRWAVTADLSSEQRELHARVQELRLHVIDDILTIKCPRCAQAFVDFDGCFALTCSRCGGAICAWCGTY